MTYLKALRAAGVRADARRRPTKSATQAIAAKVLRDYIAEWADDLRDFPDDPDEWSREDIVHDIEIFAAERGIDLEASDE